MDYDCGRRPVRKKTGSREAEKLRSSYKWHKKRERARERDLPLGRACLSEGRLCGEELEVHHIIPIEEAPELALEDDNLITLCGGKRYMPSQIKRDKACETVNAAQVMLIPCTKSAPVISGKDAYNRPVYGEPQVRSFPGILPEKHVGFAEGQLNASIERGVMLTAPKTIHPAVGDEIHAHGAKYAVQRAYLLDPHKNDYEIVERRDA